MKLFTNTLAIALVFLTSLSAYASREFTVEVKNDQVLNIKISNISEVDELIMIDNEGEILYKEKFLAQPFEKSISLKNLPNGVYSVSLDDKDMISTKTITKTDEEIKVSKTAVAFKPHFKKLDTDAKKLRVAFTNPTFDITHLKVFDNYGELIIDVSNKEAVFNKVLDFSEVPTGEYSIAINNSGKSYYQNFTIK